MTEISVVHKYVGLTICPLCGSSIRGLLVSEMEIEEDKIQLIDSKISVKLEPVSMVVEHHSCEKQRDKGSGEFVSQTGRVPRPYNRFSNRRYRTNYGQDGE